jgi:hypothetical protein
MRGILVTFSLGFVFGVVLTIGALIAMLFAGEGADDYPYGNIDEHR